MFFFFGAKRDDFEPLKWNLGERGTSARTIGRTGIVPAGIVALDISLFFFFSPLFLFLTRLVWLSQATDSH